MTFVFLVEQIMPYNEGGGAGGIFKTLTRAQRHVEQLLVDGDWVEPPFEWEEVRDGIRISDGYGWYYITKREVK